MRVVSKVNLPSQTASDVLDLVEQRLKKDSPPEILWIEPLHSPWLYSQFYAALKTQTSRLAFWLECVPAQLAEILKLPVDGVVLRNLSSEPKTVIEETFRQIQNTPKITILIEDRVESVKKIIPLVKGLTLLGLHAVDSVFSFRALGSILSDSSINLPTLLTPVSHGDSLATASVMGSLICDRYGDMILASQEILSDRQLDFAYNLLQACGARITKTEYVSCPSCGRTLFDLQTTTERIKSKTSHLKGVKIAIMGCIVNGPGEMADADFGYVGGGPGKINLYVGKTCVEKSIPATIADERLIQLIKSAGRWVDPS